MPTALTPAFTGTSQQWRRLRKRHRQQQPRPPWKVPPPLFGDLPFVTEKLLSSVTPAHPSPLSAAADPTFRAATFDTIGGCCGHQDGGASSDGGSDGLFPFVGSSTTSAWLHSMWTVLSEMDRAAPWRNRPAAVVGDGCHPPPPLPHSQGGPAHSAPSSVRGGQTPTDPICSSHNCEIYQSKVNYVRAPTGTGTESQCKGTSRVQKTAYSRCALRWRHATSRSGLWSLDRDALEREVMTRSLAEEPSARRGTEDTSSGVIPYCQRVEKCFMRKGHALFRPWALPRPSESTPSS